MNSSRPSLINRYYGLMIGFFTRFLVLDVPDDLYTSHRLRLDEVFSELEVDIQLPVNHVQYVGEWTRFTENLALELKLADQELIDFFAFGHAALHLLVNPHEDAPSDRAVWDDAEEIARTYSLNWEEMTRLFQPGWEADLIDDELYSELVGRFCSLSILALWPLPKDERVCFVIMPFSDPFRGYYLSFYHRALEIAGLASIRAWVGLTNESYVRLLMIVISRCGSALADVSAESGILPNLNVLHEIGLNMGLENVTFMIQQSHEVSLPTNFTGLPIAEYNPIADNFPEDQAQELGHILAEQFSIATEAL